MRSAFTALAFAHISPVGGAVWGDRAVFQEEVTAIGGSL